jgi:hypothetical protein
MKLQNIPIEQIVWNPYRDKKLHPIDLDHVNELRRSIKDHGFFGGIKGRRRNGNVELGCGHARLEAARKEQYETLPIYIDDIDDDAMLRLMTDENATQGGSSPGAVMNEVAAVTRRLIEGLVSSDNCPEKIQRLFNGVKGIKQTRTKLRTGSDVHRTLGVDVIRAYLGQGKPELSPRTERQIREAISALKQSIVYDTMVEQILLEHPEPVAAKTTTQAVAKPKKLKRVPQRTLNERTADVFDNEHQFHAFRETVQTSVAKKAIPVDEQLALAKEIMSSKGADKKTVSASTIKAKVQERVHEFMKEQRKIDKAERDAYLADQIETEINEELGYAGRWLRSLVASLLKLEKLADKYPEHPKLGGFSAKLDELVDVIKQLSRKLK